MDIEKLRSQVEIYTEVDKALERLNSQGFYSLFHTSFQSLRSQDPYFQTLEFKKCFQVILSEMIETVWVSALPAFPNPILSIDASPPPTQRLSKGFTSRSLQKSVSSCINLRSRGTIVGPATFCREKRSIEKKIAVTPGPGDYSVEYQPGRSKSPSTTFSKEKRVLDITHKDSPGPSAYSPLTHFQSKF